MSQRQRSPLSPRLKVLFLAHRNDFSLPECSSMNDLPHTETVASTSSFADASAKNKSIEFRTSRVLSQLDDAIHRKTANAQRQRASPKNNTNPHVHLSCLRSVWQNAKRRQLSCCLTTKQKGSDQPEEKLLPQLHRIVDPCSSSGVVIRDACDEI